MEEWSSASQTVRIYEPRSMISIFNPVQNDSYFSHRVNKSGKHVDHAGHQATLEPRMGPGHPLSPVSLHFPIFCSFLLFFVGSNYFLLLSIPFLSTRIVPLRFQAGGRRKRPNLGLVCCVYFVLSVLLS